MQNEAAVAPSRRTRPRTCEACREKFRPTRSDARTCSATCRQRAHRRRIKRDRNLSRMSVHFSSQTDLWATPQDLFDALHREFNFTLDVCATAENAKCQRFYTIADDGLAQPWDGVCWMNPPYGRQLGLWMQKASDAALGGATVVGLVPARTDTRWWHDIVSAASVVSCRGG
jgi:hypothetical protein